MNCSVDVTPRHLVIVIVGLVLLAALSWGLSYAHMPQWASVGVALGIAGAKLSLVMLFFMELIEHRGGLRIVALTAPVWVAIMVLLMLGDVWTR